MTSPDPITTRNATIATSEAEVVLETYKKWPISLVEGKGSWVTDADGRRFLDLYGGHCVSILGHAHPRWLQALSEQAGKISFYSAVAHHPARAHAARLLLEEAPTGMSRIFFSNSGAEANECALKLARKHTGRENVVTFEGSFHGRTLGALSATGNTRYHKDVRPLVPGHTYLPFDDLPALDRIDKNTALVLVEPIQSMAGMRTPSLEWFQTLRDACDANGALLGFDEVQTGMGRTGTFYASTWTGATPDLITLSKGIASGYPAAATLLSEKIVPSVEIGDQGSTFGGGPLACVMIATTIETLREEGLIERARILQKKFQTMADRFSWIHEVRGRGLLLGLKIDGDARRLVSHLFDKNILAGASDDPSVLRLMPPLVLQDQDLQTLENALSDFTP